MVRTQVKSPVQWLVGSVKTLERDLPAPLMASNTLRTLGQDLFAPPNVKGWDGGIAWITTNNLLSRYNFAAFLVLGRNTLPMMAANPQKAKRLEQRLNRMNRRETPVEVHRLFSAEERSSKEKFFDALERRFLQSRLRGKQAQGLREFLDAAGALSDEVALNAVRLVLCTPEYQLT